MLLIFTTGWNLFTGLNWTVRNWTLNYPNWTLNWSRMNFQRFQPYFIYFTLYFILLLSIYNAFIGAESKFWYLLKKVIKPYWGGSKCLPEKCLHGHRVPPPPEYCQADLWGPRLRGHAMPRYKQHGTTPISNRTRHGSIYWEIRKSLGERARRNYFHLSVEQKNAK